MVSFELCFFALSLSCASPEIAPAGDTSTYTLSECIDIAVKSNPQVKSAAWQTATDKAYWRGNVAGMLPFVSGNVSHGINQGRSIDPFSNSYIDQQVSFGTYNLNASLNLWNGLSQRNAVQQTKLAYEADKFEEQQAQQTVAIAVTLAYLQVLNAEQQLAQAMRQTAVTLQQVQRLQTLDSSGNIAPALLYDMKGQLATDRINELNMESALETARLSLAQLMNIPYTQTMSLAPLPDEALASADGAEISAASLVANQPSVKAAALRVQSAVRGLHAGRGARQPSLFLAGNVGTNYSSAASRSALLNVSEVLTTNYVLVGNDKVPVYTSQPTYSSTAIAYGDQWRNNFFSSVSVGLRIPLLNGGLARQRIGLAEIGARKAAYDAQTTSTQIQRAIEQISLNMRFAKKRHQALSSQVQDFEQSFRAAEIRFNAGLGTVVDYVTVKNNLDRARSGLIAAQYECLLLGRVLAYYTEQAER